jgi:hypothetical protein
MLKSTKRAIILTRKQIVIAAIAITGLIMSAFPYTMPASADHLAVNVDEDIEIPCLPPPDANGCSIENEPEDLDFEAGGKAHQQRTFTFVPRE